MRSETGAEPGIELSPKELHKVMRYSPKSAIYRRMIKRLFKKHRTLSYADLMDYLPSVDLDKIVSVCEQLEKEGFVKEVS